MEDYGNELPSSNLTNQGGNSQSAPTDNGNDAIMELQQNVRKLNLYFMPIILAVGCVSNFIAAAALSRAPLRKKLSSIYFLSIVVVNEVFLLMRFHDWLTKETGISLYSLVGGWCQFTTFAEKAADFLSLWYPVCLSLDCYLHTVRPELHSELCSTLKARLLVIALAILSTMVFLNVSLTVGVYYPPSPMPLVPFCYTLPMFQQTMTRMSHADVVINGILSFACLTGLLSRILVEKIQEMRESIEFWLQKRESNLTGTRPRTSSVGDGDDTDQLDASKGQTMASIAYITIFMLCNLPLLGLKTKLMFKHLVRPPKPSIKAYLIKEILYCLKIVDYSATLFILLIFHAGFRCSIKRCLVTMSTKLRCHSRAGSHTNIEMRGEEEAALECPTSKSSFDESSTVEFVSHESVYV